MGRCSQALTLCDPVHAVADSRVGSSYYARVSEAEKGGLGMQQGNARASGLPKGLMQPGSSEFTSLKEWMHLCLAQEFAVSSAVWLPQPPVIACESFSCKLQGTALSWRVILSLVPPPGFPSAAAPSVWPQTVPSISKADRWLLDMSK